LPAQVRDIAGYSLLALTSDPIGIATLEGG